MAFLDFVVPETHRWRERPPRERDSPRDHHLSDDAFRLASLLGLEIPFSEPPWNLVEVHLIERHSNKGTATGLGHASSLEFVY
jgi:hypothetical protein